MRACVRIAGSETRIEFPMSSHWNQIAPQDHRSHAPAEGIASPSKEACNPLRSHRSFAISGFSCSGYPRGVPRSLAARSTLPLSGSFPLVFLSSAIRVARVQVGSDGDSFAVLRCHLNTPTAEKLVARWWITWRTSRPVRGSYLLRNRSAA